MTETDGEAAAGAQLPERRWRALAVCPVALSATLLHVSPTNVALPSIGRITYAGPSQLQ